MKIRLSELRSLVRESLVDFKQGSDQNVDAEVAEQLTELGLEVADRSERGRYVIVTIDNMPMRVWAKPAHAAADVGPEPKSSDLAVTQRPGRRMSGSRMK